MTIGPTAEALLRRKRAARGRPREQDDDDRPARAEDTAAFETVLKVCLGGVVGLAVLSECAGVGR